MRTKRSSAYKNEAALKKTSKTQVHLQTDRFGAYTKEKVAHNIATAPSDQTPSPALETFLPPSQVTFSLYRMFFLYSSLMEGIWKI